MKNGEFKKVKAKFNELKRSNKYQFPDRGILKGPTRRGVYVIYGPRDEILHVGGTPRGKHGICQRLSNHLYGQSSFTNKSVFLRRHGGRTLKKRYKYVRTYCRYQCLPIGGSSPRPRRGLHNWMPLPRSYRATSTRALIKGAHYHVVRSDSS